MYTTLEFLELLMSRNGGKIIGASLDGDVRRRLGKKCSYLHKKEYIKKNNGIWEITPLGKKYYSKRNTFKYLPSPFKEKQKKQYLIIFDIPEAERKKRDYLRKQIREFGYVLIQQSVWYGPGPLPVEFLHYLKTLNIKDNIMIFKTNQKLL